MNNTLSLTLVAVLAIVIGCEAMFKKEQHHYVPYPVHHKHVVVQPVIKTVKVPVPYPVVEYKPYPVIKKVVEKVPVYIKVKDYDYKGGYGGHEVGHAYGGHGYGGHGYGHEEHGYGGHEEPSYGGHGYGGHEEHGYGGHGDEYKAK